MNDLKEKLSELVTELYHNCSCTVEPLYPKILVRILPKQQRRGLIYLPEHQQNKPVFEAVVLNVYRPRTVTETYYIDGELRELTRVEESPVKIGDHILVPSMEFGITPVWPLDDGVGDYRFIPQEHVKGVLHYASERTVDWLTGILGSKTKAEDLLQNADVIRKDIVSLTVSGA